VNGAPDGVVEVFAGSATLAATARKRGCKAVAVDQHSNKHKPQMNITIRDMLAEGAVQGTLDIILKLKAECRKVLVWMAPPCGTASKAREIPLKNGGAGPRPLRSKEHPAGLPTLSLGERERERESRCSEPALRSHGRPP